MEEITKKNQSSIPIIGLIFGCISFLLCILTIFSSSFLLFVAAIVLLFLIFVFSILGLIFGIISKTKKYEPKIISTLAIIFSAIPSAVTIIIVLLFVGMTAVTTSSITSKIIDKAASHTSSNITNESELDASLKILYEFLDGEEEFDWYKSIGTIQTSTSEEPPATVRATVYIGYIKDDKNASAEIREKSAEINEFLRDYFQKKTAEDLKNVYNEETFKIEIRNGINEKILTDSKIRAISFDQLDVIKQ